MTAAVSHKSRLRCALVIVGNSNPASKRSRIGRCSWLMRDVCSLIWLTLIGLFRSRASLQAEILTLRHQLNVLRRKSPQRLTFTSIDRLVFAGLYRLAPGVLDALKIVRPETVIRWHRAGFRAYWRWKSRPRSGRPKTPLEIRQLIREISLANPLWGAPRIHGELLMLGFDVVQSTVSRYMVRAGTNFDGTRVAPLPDASVECACVDLPSAAEQATDLSTV